MKDIAEIEKILTEACDTFLENGEGRKIIQDMFWVGMGANACRCPLAALAGETCFDGTDLYTKCKKELDCNDHDLDSFMRGFDGLPLNGRSESELQMFDIGVKLQKKYITFTI
jgi:hypothetical protein